MKILVLRSTVRVRVKKKPGPGQAPNEGAAPHLAFAKEPRLLETSLDAERMVEEHLVKDPGLAKKADPYRVADEVYELIKRELKWSLKRGERKQ